MLTRVEWWPLWACYQDHHWRCEVRASIRNSRHKGFAWDGIGWPPDANALTPQYLSVCRRWVHRPDSNAPQAVAVANILQRNFTATQLEMGRGYYL